MDDQEDLLPTMPVQSSWATAEGSATPTLALGTSSSEQSLKSPWSHNMARRGAVTAQRPWGLGSPGQVLVASGLQIQSTEYF